MVMEYSGGNSTFYLYFFDNFRWYGKLANLSRCKNFYSFVDKCS